MALNNPTAAATTSTGSETSSDSSRACCASAISWASGMAVSPSEPAVSHGGGGARVRARGGLCHRGFIHRQLRTGATGVDRGPHVVGRATQGPAGLAGDAQLVGAAADQAGFAIEAAAVEVTPLAFGLLAAGGQDEGTREGSETIEGRHVGGAAHFLERPRKTASKQWRLTSRARGRVSNAACAV